MGSMRRRTVRRASGVERIGTEATARPTPVRIFSSTAAAALVVGVLAAPAMRAEAAYPGGNGRIAFELSSNIYTVPAGGSAATKLTSDGLSHSPRWSPDGKRIAFNRAGDIWVMNANGTLRRQLTT